MRSITLLAFLLSTFFGNACMMPMASAASMPMQDKSMEMNMTPMAPMSPAHCEHCAHLTRQNAAPSDACAGHCLAKAQEALAAAHSISSSFQLLTALPATFPIPSTSSSVEGRMLAFASPPIQASIARTVVMIQ